MRLTVGLQSLSGQGATRMLVFALLMDDVVFEGHDTIVLSKAEQHVRARPLCAKRSTARLAAAR